MQARGGLALALVALAARVASGFSLASTAFPEGGTIPVEYTCDGADRSPPLAWTDPPEGTRSFALVCEDPDAPAGTWVHWVLFDLGAEGRQLPPGVPATATLAAGGRQGRNDFQRLGWGGPCPPRGAPHRYVFRLHALDTTLGAGVTTRDDLARAMAGHVRGTAELLGRYQRSETSTRIGPDAPPHRAACSVSGPARDGTP